MHNAPKRQTYACARCARRVEQGRAKCPACGHLHALNPSAADTKNFGLLRLSEHAPKKAERHVSGPWDPVFGGGIVRRSVSLLGGEAGCGKSTLAMQIVDAIAGITNQDAIYISTEEEFDVLNERTSRLKLVNRDHVLILPMSKVTADNIGGAVRTMNPSIIVLDSLAYFVGLDHEAGVQTTHRLKEYSNELNSPILIIDHITKDGKFAGAESLKHSADMTAMYTVFDDNVRMLQTMKNRNGPGFVKVFFDMVEEGLIALAPCPRCLALGETVFKCTDHEEEGDHGR